MADEGYVNYFEVLELPEDAKAGEVRKNYKHKMKHLVMEIARVEITEERRARYLLEMAKLNAAFYILRNNAQRETYWRERAELVALEARWKQAATHHAEDVDALRRTFERKLRDFLARYVEEAMLEAGRDRDCVEASHWDPAHERHASRILREYRQRAYQTIMERLPFYEVTEPNVDWNKRRQVVTSLLAVEDRR
ncbi:MAG TPA: hypothetical protein ENN80_05760 [Candidatus Hydrogenedentes bacterium]|nr:hypothetical protein [Candidatus Hydrogenedentota bacterium]